MKKILYIISLILCFSLFGLNTHAAGLKPAKVKGVSVPEAGLETTSAIIEWKAAKKATSYVVKLYKYNNNNDKYQSYEKYTLDGNSLSQNITGLDIGTKYKVKVRARRAVGANTYNGKWSKTKKFTTRTS